MLTHGCTTAVEAMRGAVPPQDMRHWRVQVPEANEGPLLAAIQAHAFPQRLTDLFACDFGPLPALPAEAQAEADAAFSNMYRPEAELVRLGLNSAADWVVSSANATYGVCATCVLAQKCVSWSAPLNG